MNRALAAALVLAACAPAGGGNDPIPAAPAAGGTPAVPARPGEAAEESTGRGRAVRLDPHPYARIVITRQDTAAMQLAVGTQQQTFDRTMYFTSIAERAGEGHRVTFVLDSVRAAAGTFYPADSIQAAEGSRWTATLHPTGRLADLQLDTLRGRRRSAVGEQAMRMLEILYPVTPEAGVRGDASWTDSVRNRYQAGGLDVTERGLVRYRAAPGADGFEVTGEGRMTQEGTGTQFGQQLEMSGDGTRRVVYRIDGDGRLLGATGSDSAELEIIVPAVGQTVPVSQSGAFTATVVPQ